MLVTYHAVGVGGYTVEQDHAPQLFEAGDVVPIGRAFLQEEVEMGHVDAWDGRKMANVACMEDLQTVLNGRRVQFVVVVEKCRRRRQSLEKSGVGPAMLGWRREQPQAGRQGKASPASRLSAADGSTYSREEIRSGRRHVYMKTT